MTYFFSPSTLSLLEECELCFWLHFKKGVKRPSLPFPSLPGGMDRVLKQHFDAFMREGKLPPELASLDGSAKLFDDVEKLAEWRNSRKGLRWKDEEGNVLMGAVDTLLVKDGLLVVLDYKTRGSPIKSNTASYYGRQLSIYTFLLNKNGYRTASYAYLLFYSPDKVLPNGDVVFHSELVKVPVDVALAPSLVNKALAVLKSEDAPEPSPNCPFCSYRMDVSRALKT